MDDRHDRPTHLDEPLLGPTSTTNHKTRPRFFFTPISHPLWLDRGPHDRARGTDGILTVLFSRAHRLALDHCDGLGLCEMYKISIENLFFVSFFLVKI